MDCPRCGSGNPDGNSYCGKCGASLDDPTDGVEWSKQYGPVDFGGRVMGTREGVFVETNYSLFGWNERTRYPRWMVTWPLIVFLGLLYVMSFLMMFQSFRYPDNTYDYMSWGLAALGASLLFTYIIYRVYYNRDSDEYRADTKYIEQIAGDQPSSPSRDSGSEAQRKP